MSSVQMFPDVSRARESLSAKFARNGKSEVGDGVMLKLFRPLVGPAALFAFERSFVGVDGDDVIPQLEIGHEGFAALVALFIFLPLYSFVNPVVVIDQARLGRILSPALITDVGFLSCVGPAVRHQVPLAAEGLVANVALERRQMPDHQMSTVRLFILQLFAALLASDFAITKLNLIQSPDCNPQTLFLVFRTHAFKAEFFMADVAFKLFQIVARVSLHEVLFQMIVVTKRSLFSGFRTVQANVSSVLFLHLHSRVLYHPGFIICCRLQFADLNVSCVDAFTSEFFLTDVALEIFLRVTEVIFQVVFTQMTEVSERSILFLADSVQASEPSIFFLHFQSCVLLYVTTSWNIFSFEFVFVVFIIRVLIFN